ncbi:hypothetical protein DSCO28_11150 [Desulfosarcina ovata subsp. sediminis]|uniref:Uncharacterized protein n=1 Tax=Desulfosarcina ovata subsp. sediminis TaxID=885957 RepID=A0A5K7ZLL3_9BACT|nr:hypothetical protein DSCO28_11150 [Desulfosarcina ovata subsp. sediminis]
MYAAVLCAGDKIGGIRYPRFQEVTGKKRNRLYSYVEYIRIMNEGTELPR